jgi:hypothetical protein
MYVLKAGIQIQVYLSYVVFFKHDCMVVSHDEF